MQSVQVYSWPSVADRAHHHANSWNKRLYEKNRSSKPGRIMIDV